MTARRQSIMLPPNLLKDISDARLKELEHKEEEFLTFFSQLDLPQTRKIQNDQDELNSANRELALENTERRPLYEEKKQRLTESCVTAAELKELYEKKKRQLKAKSRPTDRSVIFQELKQAVKTAEKQSEDLADSYLDGAVQISSDEFTSRFLADRSSYWSRKVKVEKMEIIMKQQPSPPIPPKQRPYPPPAPSQSMPTPYPPSGPSSGDLPPYNSLAPANNYTNPTQSVSASFARPLPQTPPTASMPMPGGYQQSPPGGGYPQASYRPPPYPAQPTQSYRYPYPQQQASYYPPPAQYGAYPRR